MEFCKVDGCSINYSKIPKNCKYMEKSFRNYLETGVKPGGFAYSLLCNDLRGAVTRADEQNLASILEWIDWITWEIPSMAHGSKKIVDRLIEHGGAKGFYSDQFIKLEVE